LIHFGSNSGYQAINLAVHFGVSRILLLGFDMQVAPDGRKHWFGNHPGNMNNNSPYGLFIEKFGTLPPDLKKAGVEVVNCSRVTALECFQRMTIEEAL
jgi:hypothetical protein